MKRLAIITTHPIQYNAPLFRLLSVRNQIQIKVFYTWGESVLQKKYDPGFEKNIEWDIPLLEGYDYCFLKNSSKDLGSHHYKGIINPTLIDEIKAWQADALLVYGWNFNSHWKILKHFKNKIPVYFRGDSTLLNEKQGIKKLIRRIVLCYVYRHIDKAFVVGTHNRNYFLKHGLKPEQLIWAPHAVDNDRFKNESIQLKEITQTQRQKIGFEPNDLVVLFVGKLDKNKNAIYLLKLASLLQDYSNIKFLIVGNGPEALLLKEQIVDLEKVKLMPFQNQSRMPEIYAMSDVLIMPSFSETWGLALNEAMACGLPVIASNNCGAAIDLIVPGTGLIFDLNETKPVIDYLINLSNNPKRKPIQKFFIQNQIEQFSFEKIAVALESCLNA